MRRIAVLAVGLSLGCLALSESANARPRGLSGLFGVITKPLGTILRPPRGISRRGTHRRPAAARTRPQPNPSTTQAAASAPVAGAAAASAAATAAATTAGAATTTETATPGTATLQRTVAAPQSGDEPRPRGRDASRTVRNAPHATPTQLGTVGPSSWPSAFEDILGFTLWPDKYSEQLRAHGIGDVMSALFAPGASRPSGSQTVARSPTHDTTRSDTDGAASSSSCASSSKASSAEWPAAKIEQTLALSESQRAALDQFRAAVGEGIATIHAACREDAPSTSAERLQVMQRTLWAVRDAAMLVRAPLINFHRSLADEQKKHFAIEASRPDPRLAQMEQRARQGRGGNPQIPREVARMCGMSAANEWPLRQIEQAIRPNPAQKASLEALQKKAGEMGQLLIASCLQPNATTPEARLDQALDRLTAMLFAITNVTLAFNDFHGQLSDEQKAKLGSFGL